MKRPRVVALGGGHGLAASLRALARLDVDLTAIVTVADDGGSSGRLRTELGVIPPGDLRMALAALAGTDDQSRTWQRLLQHRFTGDGALAGHAVGNIMLAGLEEVAGGMVEALDLLGRLVGARGRVLPASPIPLNIVAYVAGLEPGDSTALHEVRGQVAVATTAGSVCALHLEPVDPPACEEAVRAVREADFVVLGPGSWFTSVMTHLLIPELREALVATRAARVITVNLTQQVGETDGWSPEAHLEALASHAPKLVPNVVLADAAAVVDRHGLMSCVQAAGGRLVLADIASATLGGQHDTALLAQAYAAILDHETKARTAWR